MDIYESQMSQLDPELRARLEEHLARRWGGIATAPQAPTGPDDDTALSWVELAEIMEEPPGGHNFGRTTFGLTYTDEDDETPTPGRYFRKGRPKRSLDTRAGVIRDYMRHGGAHEEFAPPTGMPTGRPPAHPEGVTQAVIAAIIARVECEPAVFARLVRQGAKAPAEREARARLARAIAELMEDAKGLGIEEALMAAFGCSRSALHRLARQGRAAPPG